MPLVIGYQNEALTGAVTVSSAVTGLDGTQLQNDQGSAATAWQTPAGTVAGTITLAREAGTSWRGFALCNTNLTATATVTWQVLSGGAAVYTGVSGPVVAGYRQAVLIAPAPVVGDTLEVTISDSANPDGFLNIAQVYAGPLFEPVRNYSYTSAVTASDSSVITTTRSGAEFVRNDWRRRGFNLALNAVQPGELPTVRAIDMAARLGGNLLFVPDPASTTVNAEAVFGRLVPADDGIGFANNSKLTRTYRATVTERL